MADSGISREVRIGSVDLTIETDKGGKLLYEERAIAGADVTDERSALHFSDEFTSWHKGAFVKENVQDGYYYLSCNVDASYPGRLFPAMKRDLNISLPAPTHANGYGIIASITPTPWAVGASGATYAIILAYQKKNIGSTYPSDSVKVCELTETGILDTVTPINQNFNLETNRLHFNYLRLVWLKEHWHAPMLEAGYVRRDSSGSTPWTLKPVPVWAFGSGTNKAFRAYYPSTTATPVVTSAVLHFSNVALDADITLLASWTNPGEPIPGVTSANFEMVQIAMLGRLPYVATRQGVFTFGNSGWAESLFPQFQESPSNSYDFKAYRNYNAMIIAGTSNGQAVMFTGADAVQIGPMVNPAARFTNSNAPTFLDFWSTSSGRVFAVTNDGLAFTIFEAVPRTPGESGPGAFAWHTLICIPTEVANPPINAYADTMTSNNFSMTRPIALINFAAGWPFASASTYLWYGSGRADGRIFSWRAGNWGDLEVGEYPHEDMETIVGTDNIYWRSGRYNRGQKRAMKHWIQLVFDSENASATNHVLVDVAVDGAAFSQVGDLTTNHQAVPIDVRGYDIEIRLRWKPEAGVGLATPMTIKRIIYEGREQPQKLVAITFVAKGTLVSQAGGVRKKLFGSNNFTTVDALARGLKQTFRDPYKNSRKVVVLHPTQHDLVGVDGEAPPRAQLRVNLLEVP